jgi:hypothetical protein
MIRQLVKFILCPFQVLKSGHPKSESSADRLYISNSDLQDPESLTPSKSIYIHTNEEPKSQIPFGHQYHEFPPQRFDCRIRHESACENASELDTYDVRDLI